VEDIDEAMIHGRVEANHESEVRARSRQLTETPSGLGVRMLRKLRREEGITRYNNARVP
jgi:hypothetical protein